MWLSDEGNLLVDREVDTMQKMAGEVQRFIIWQLLALVPIALLLTMTAVSLWASYDLHNSLGKVSGVVLGVLVFWAGVRWMRQGDRLELATALFLLAGGALERTVPQPPRYDGKRQPDLRTALSGGPKYFAELMAALLEHPSRVLVIADLPPNLTAKVRHLVKRRRHWCRWPETGTCRPWCRRKPCCVPTGCKSGRFGKTFRR